MKKRRSETRGQQQKKKRTSGQVFPPAAGGCPFYSVLYLTQNTNTNTYTQTQTQSTKHKYKYFLINQSIALKKGHLEFVEMFDSIYCTYIAVNFLETE